MTNAERDALREFILRTVEGAVTKAVSGLDSLVGDSVSKAVAGLPVPKDGADGKDAVVDIKALEQVIREEMARVEFNAPPGKDGVDGKDAEPVDRVALAKDVLALIPVPRDGRDGVASVDEIKSLAATAVTEHLATEVQKAVDAKIAELPDLRYLGVFREGESYRKGNFATFGGCVWHANEDTTDKPGAGSKAWTLAVKHGRDGKDAK